VSVLSEGVNVQCSDNGSLDHMDLFFKLHSVTASICTLVYLSYYRNYV